MVGSLGIVIVASAGTPKRATNNQTDPTARLGAKSVRFQVCPDNAGIVYIGLQGMEGSPQGPNLLAALAKPVSGTTGPFDAYEVTVPDVPAGLNAADLYVDVSNSGDGVIVSYTAN